MSHYVKAWKSNFINNLKKATRLSEGRLCIPIEYIPTKEEIKNSELEDGRDWSKEYVYRMNFCNTRSYLVIYSSVDKETDQFRDVNKDRIRIVKFYYIKNKKVPQRIKWINRTRRWEERLVKEILSTVRI